MLLGEYEHKIDEKGRLSLPPKLRKEFKEGGVLARGLEKCLRVYPLSEWAKLAERYSGLPPEHLKTRRMNRFIFAFAFEFELDGQGRISLPMSLRRYSGIKDTVIINGINTFLELWNKENWGAEEAAVSEQAWQMFESTETYG